MIAYKNLLNLYYWIPKLFSRTQKLNKKWLLWLTMVYQFFIWAVLLSVANSYYLQKLILGDQSILWITVMTLNVALKSVKNPFEFYK